MTILHFFPVLLCILFGFPYAQGINGLNGIWNIYGLYHSFQQRFNDAVDYEVITSEVWFPNDPASPEAFPRQYVMGDGGYVSCDAFTGAWCGRTNMIFTLSNGTVLPTVPGFPNCWEIARADSSGVGGSCLLTLTEYSVFDPEEKYLYSGAYMQGATSATFLMASEGSFEETNANWEVGIPYIVGGHPTSGGGSEKAKKAKKGKKVKKVKKVKKSESSDDHDYSYITENYGACADVKFSSRFSPLDSFSVAIAALGTLCREIREADVDPNYRAKYSPYGGRKYAGYDLFLFHKKKKL